MTLSHDILREYREYERTSTTVLNAYVGPRVGTYLRKLDSYLRDEKFGGGIQIMRSNGGVMGIGLAQESIQVECFPVVRIDAHLEAMPLGWQLPNTPRVVRDVRARDQLAYMVKCPAVERRTAPVGERGLHLECECYLE